MRMSQGAWQWKKINLSADDSANLADLSETDENFVTADELVKKTVIIEFWTSCGWAIEFHSWN